MSEDSKRSVRGADQSAEDVPLAEAALVIESDELDLSEEEEAAPVDVPVEDEPVPDEPVEDELVKDEPVPEEEAVADEPVAEEPVAEEEVREEEHLVIPAHAVSDDWEPEPPARGAAPTEGDGIGDGTGGDDAPASSRHWGRYLLLAVLVLVGAAYVAGYFLTGSRMPAQATIGGVDVSGMSPAAAREAVDAALTPNEDREIELVHGKKTFTVKPSAAGLALDVDRSVDEAGGARSWDPRDMVALFIGKHDHPPALTVDEDALSSAVAAIGESVDVPVVEPQVTFPDAKPKARQPKAGLVMSREDTAAAIRAAYLVSDEPIEVPTVPVEPTVDADDLATAMTTIAEPAVSGPVTLKVGDKSVALPVTAYAPALSIRVRDGALAPHLDPDKLAGPLTDSTTGIGTKAVDATVKIQGGKPVVVPGKQGVGLQPEEMATKLIPALTQTGDARSVAVEAKVVEPQFTTEDAKALKITEKIGEFKTQFPYAEYRNTNQGRAAELIDGTIIKPGETFSFNDVVGERTEANGFVTGTVINGGVFREELGGGVSQVATTMYNAGFFAGMEDVEHHPHAFYIDRYPVGREATVYFGSLDLRWKNPTDYGVLIRSYVKKSTPSSPGSMHVELWSTKVWDKIEASASPRRNGRTPGTQYDDTNRCVSQAPVQGFDIDIIRKFIKDGKVVKTEKDTANYQAADRVICGKKPEPKKPKKSDD
ncbi:VanW family protein [Aeromicrobium wangtongii]|uniref:VanW family protein n=1 Tax=Aeromicrobium wangtongii TaxID=2969247 RepID=A0ABY5MCU5_9ACTN|nr:VanW family protein [Aeromicrobium wangtongii]MCD9197046.1 VanW family protein [Aeromicrobium wangtongii]UUP14547.1 VanW family protein [Aeromicrobium wangtongii]